MSDYKNNESKLKSAGLRMALKLIPQELLDQAPAALEKYLLNELTDVEPMTGESGSCFLIAPDSNTGAIRVMTVTLDEEIRVKRIVKVTSLSDLFRKIVAGMKEL